MNATPRLALVIPAYNEEKTVGAVVRDCLAALPGAEVCVVSDGSSDRTAARAREAGATVLAEIGAALEALPDAEKDARQAELDQRFQPRSVTVDGEERGSVGIEL